MPGDLLLRIACVLDLIGLALLMISGGGTLLASRTAQKIRFLKGKTFTRRSVPLRGRG